MCKNKLLEQGFKADQIVTEQYLHMRYEGTDCALMISRPKFGDYLASFLERYKTEFGFVIAAKNVIVDDVRVRGVGKYVSSEEPELESVKQEPKPEKVRS